MDSKTLGLIYIALGIGGIAAGLVNEKLWGKILGVASGGALIYAGYKQMQSPVPGPVF